MRIDFILILNDLVCVNSCHSQVSTNVLLPQDALVNTLSFNCLGIQLKFLILHNFLTTCRQAMTVLNVGLLLLSFFHLPITIFHFFIYQL